MKTAKIKAWVTSIFFVSCIFGFGIGFLLLPDNDISISERRNLKQSPKLSITTITDGSAFDEYEVYIQDQFPMRNTLRTFKAISEYYCFIKADNNDIYICDGFVCKQDYPLDHDAVLDASEKCNELYYELFDGRKAYYSIVPDKNFFVAEKSGHLSYDYDELYAIMKGNMDENIQYINISDMLSINQYYNTDIHWKQECIVSVADEILVRMGETPPKRDYESHSMTPFYGAYFGQAALPFPADELIYLTNDTLNHCVVYNPIKDEIASLYDLSKFGGIDSYSIFASGSESLLIITNPYNNSNKELYIVRDSFTSSLVPLLIENYTKIVLIDPRYISCDVLTKYVTPNENATVLYIFSTTILNKGYLFR